MNKLLINSACLFFVSFSAASAQQLFENWANYSVEYGPVSIFASDLDSDGDQDLAIGYWGISDDSVISILKNNGDATFAPRVNYRVGKTPRSISGADFDGDGDVDLAITIEGEFEAPDSTISILINNGDGTFAPKMDYIAGLRPMVVFASDLDKDSDADLAVGNWENGTISVLKNRGDGIFGSKTDYPAGSTISVIAADLDNDTYPDLVVANQSPCPNGPIAILKNNGDGTFATKQDYPSGYPLFVAASDLDGDGALDLIATNFGYSCSEGSATSILKNNGDGTFTTKTDYRPQDDPASVIAADLDGDRDNDLAVANWGFCDYWREYCVTGDFLTVFLNNGDGIFTLEDNYPTGLDPFSVVGEDFDGDGDIDLAITNSSDNKIQILRNNAAPFYAKGDIDGDGTVTLLDVVILLNCIFGGTNDCKLHGSSDVNCDGHLSPADLVLELRMFFLDIPFPC